MASRVIINKLLSSNSAATRKRSLFGMANGKSIVDGVLDQGMSSPNFALMDKAKWLYDYATFGWRIPEPKIRKCTDNELHIEMPASGLSETVNILMKIDEKNRLHFSGKNADRDIDYQLHLDLPQDANFEKATFKARLEWGMVYVTVTNFKREEVEVGYE